MKSNSLSRLSNQDLTSGLAAAADRERTSTAELVAYIAEFDARGLYRPAGYPSMHRYCEAVLGLSPAAAYKRINAARIARQFPVVLQALGDGRLNLTAVNLLAAYITLHNAQSLLAAAYGQAKPEIERMLAERFPRSESLALIETTRHTLPPAVMPASAPPAPPPTNDSNVMTSPCQLAPERVELPDRTDKKPTSAVVPLAADRFSVHLSFGQEMKDDLQRAQELLGTIAFGNVAAVLHRGLQALIRELEKRKFASTERPRTQMGRSRTTGRTVPAHVMREVWARDGGRCTFVGDHGARCPARAGLEFDHVQPVALGGESTTDNVRLLCRAHNQYAAEQVFGADYMNAKREAAARGRKERQSGEPGG